MLRCIVLGNGLSLDGTKLLLDRTEEREGLEYKNRRWHFVDKYLNNLVGKLCFAASVNSPE